MPVLKKLRNCTVQELDTMCEGNVCTTCPNKTICEELTPYEGQTPFNLIGGGKDKPGNIHGATAIVLTKGIRLNIILKLYVSDCGSHIYHTFECPACKVKGAKTTFEYTGNEISLSAEFKCAECNTTFLIPSYHGYPCLSVIQLPKGE